MKRKPKPAVAPSHSDLRRWCIELAVRWPSITEHYQTGTMGGGINGPTSRTTDADVIGRAKKIEAYVTDGK